MHAALAIGLRQPLAETLSKSVFAQVLAASKTCSGRHIRYVFQTSSSAARPAPFTPSA